MPTTKTRPKKKARKKPAPGSMTATTQCRKWKTSSRGSPRCKRKKGHRLDCDFKA